MPSYRAPSHNPPYNHPIEVSSLVGYPQGRRCGQCRGRLSSALPQHAARARGPHFRRPPPVKCRLRVLFSTWRSLISTHRGCSGRVCPFPFVVGFLVGFLCVALASFLRLGRLFSGLGRLFWVLAWGGCALFFRIFVSWLVPAPLVLARSPRLLPWFVRSGGPACSVGSRWRCSVCRSRLGCRGRRASPPRVLGSLPGSAVALGVRGGWAGRSPRLALLRSVCRSARVACLPRAFSFRFFSRFAVWHPPRGFLVC